MLFFAKDQEPVFDQLDSRVHQHFFKFGYRTEELLVLFICAETHDTFNGCAVMTIAVKQHNFYRTWQMKHVVLKMPLGLFPGIRRRQRSNSTHTRVEALGDAGDALDHAAFSYGVTSLKTNHHLVARFDNPILQLYQFGLYSE